MLSLDQILTSQQAACQHVWTAGASEVCLGRALQGRCGLNACDTRLGTDTLLLPVRQRLCCCLQQQITQRCCRVACSGCLVHQWLLTRSHGFLQVYDIPHLHVEGKLCRTNLAPRTIMRGPGFLNAVMVAEQVTAPCHRMSPQLSPTQGANFHTQPTCVNVHVQQQHVGYILPPLRGAAVSTWCRHTTKHSRMLRCLRLPSRKVRQYQPGADMAQSTSACSDA